MDTKLAPLFHAAALSVLLAAGCGPSQAEKQAVLKEQAALEDQDPLAGAEAGEIRTIDALQMALCWCPRGNFKMGCPRSDPDAESNEWPQVDVWLSRGYWLGQTEVTQKQWQQVMGTTPWKGEEYVVEGDNYPALCVSHGRVSNRKTDDDSAIAFCLKLTEMEREAGRLPPDWEYRLPTDAQWEYACRAGSTTNYSFGDSPAELVHYAWFDQNKTQKHAHEVAVKLPNAWGFYDMHGNVAEWCLDDNASDRSLKSGIDPYNEAVGARSFRGGTWSDTAAMARSCCRSGMRADYRDGFIGFRVALCPVRP